MDLVQILGCIVISCDVVCHSIVCLIGVTCCVAYLFCTLVNCYFLGWNCYFSGLVWLWLFYLILVVFVGACYVLFGGIALFYGLRLDFVAFALVSILVC